MAFGKAVVSINVAESATSTETMAEATALSHGRFAQGPSTSRSLHSSRSMTVVVGSTIPARACTDVVMRPSGALGMSTRPAARATSTAKLP